MSVVSDYWGRAYFDEAFNRTEWQAHPLSLERLFFIQGERVRERWFAENYLGGKPAARALGVGVGRAETEIGLLVSGMVEHYDLYDVSHVGLEHAKKLAEKAGLGDRVTCHCVDITSAKLGVDKYDLVTFVASLHHIANLEETLWAINRALKLSGVIWAANEYVGPDRFGYPEEHLRVVRAFHASLPARFRKHGFPELDLPTSEEVAAADPSEAPCSSLIVPTMRKIFPRLDVTELYGSFAFMLFWGLNHDALYESEEGAELVRIVLAMDQALVEAGTLPSYFVHMVARKTTPLQERVIRMGVPHTSRLYLSAQWLRNTLYRRDRS